jgi:hypothetical protein
MLSDFIEGLKLFFSSRRLRWLTVIFFIGAFVITIWEQLIAMWPLLTVLGLLSSGIFPGFFMVTAIVSFLGLGRFVADEESYFKSFIMTVIWMAIAGILMLTLVIFVQILYQIIFIVIAFLGWVVFQSYFATRSSLSYAESVTIEDRSALVRALFVFIHLLNYFVIVASFVATIIFINPGVFLTPAFFIALLGVFLAMGFNFLNGLILAAERNKPHASNLVFLGLFISFYSAYFIYNVLKPFVVSLDLISLGISVFFILYTMSGVGRTLSSRADQDTRWKLSKELAATLTYFLASGFMFVDASISALVADPNLVGAAGDAVKLLIFPFVALVMELLFIRRTRRLVKTEPADDSTMIVQEEPAAEELGVEHPEEVTEEQPKESEEELSEAMEDETQIDEEDEEEPASEEEDYQEN